MTRGDDAAEIFSHPASDFAAKLERFSPGVTEIAASTFVEGDLRLVPSFGEASWVSSSEPAHASQGSQGDPGVRDVPAHAVPPGRQDRRGHRRHKRPRVRSRGRSFGAGRSPYTLRGRVASRRRATLVGHVSFVVASPVPTPTPSLTPSAPSSGDRLLPRRTAARSSSRWLATARACTRARGRARTSTRRWLLGVPRAWP